MVESEKKPSKEVGEGWVAPSSDNGYGSGKLIEKSATDDFFYLSEAVGITALCEDDKTKRVKMVRLNGKK